MLLPISVIQPGVQYRPVNPDYVTRLAGEFQRDGMQRPVAVLHGILRGKGGGDRPLFTLLSGGGQHRLAAAKKVHMKEIAAEIVGAEDYTRQLAELDDNLHHGGLTALERAEHFVARHALFQKLHPEMLHKGGDRRSGKFRKRPKLTDGFLKETAAAFGIGYSTVALIVARGQKITPEVKALIAPHREISDSPAELDRLAQAAPALQLALVNAVLAGDAATIREALHLATTIHLAVFSKPPVVPK